MSKVRYYTDEHVAKVVINGLRQRGVDVLTVPESNMLSASDEEQLAFAFSQQRAIFTQDDDFLRMAAQGHEHAGIIYAPQRTPIGEIISGLMLIYSVLSAKEMIGNIEFL